MPKAFVGILIAVGVLGLVVVGAVVVQQQRTSPSSSPGTTLLPFPSASPVPSVMEVPASTPTNPPFLASPGQPTPKPSGQPVVAQPTPKPSGQPIVAGNLRVDVRAVTIDPVTRDETPVNRFLITSASLQCYDAGVAQGGTTSFPKWYRGWCDKGGSQAINLPARTDAAGRTTLAFSVNPAPEKAEIGVYSGPDRAPLVSILLPNGGFGSYEPELLSASHWRVNVVLPKR